MPNVRDRSDANPNTGVITGRADLGSGLGSIPRSAHIPASRDAEIPMATDSAQGNTAEEADSGGTVVAKSQGPVVARPSSGMLTAQATGFVPTVSVGAHADKTTKTLASGPAVANPDLGYVNSRPRK